MAIRKLTLLSMHGFRHVVFSLMPIIALIIPGELGWKEWIWAGFNIGHFFGTVITFLIVAFVIFLLVKLLKKWGIK